MGICLKTKLGVRKKMVAAFDALREAARRNETIHKILEMLIKGEDKSGIDATLMQYIVLKRIDRHVLFATDRLKTPLLKPVETIEEEEWQKQVEEARGAIYAERDSVRNAIKATIIAADFFDRKSAIGLWAFVAAHDEMKEWIAAKCMELQTKWGEASAKIIWKSEELDTKGASTSLAFARLVLGSSLITVANVVITGVPDASFYVMTGTTLLLVLKYLLNGSLLWLPTCIPFATYQEFIGTVVKGASPYNWLWGQLDRALGVGAEVLQVAQTFLSNVVIRADPDAVLIKNGVSNPRFTHLVENQSGSFVEGEYSDNLNIFKGIYKDGFLGRVLVQEHYYAYLVQLLEGLKTKLLAVDWLAMFLSGSGAVASAAGVATMVGGLVFAFCRADKLKELRFGDVVLITNLFTTIGLMGVYYSSAPTEAEKERIWDSAAYLVSTGYMAGGIGGLRRIFKNV